jgi:hypothetical protein
MRATYKVVSMGTAYVLYAFASPKNVVGDQRTISPPETRKKAVSPLQILVSPNNVMTGAGITCTNIVSVSVHPEGLSPVTT